MMGRAAAAYDPELAAAAGAITGHGETATPGTR